MPLEVNGTVKTLDRRREFGIQLRMLWWKADCNRYTPDALSPTLASDVISFLGLQSAALMVVDL